MRNIMSGRLWCLTVFCLFISVFPLGAQSFADRFSWSVAGSVLVFPEDNGKEGDPAPILPSLGGAAAYNIFGPLWIELTEDLYFTHYRYSTKLNRAVPAAIENRSAFVFGMITGIEARVLFPLSDTIAVRVYGGPAADIRIVTLASGLVDKDSTGGLDTNAKLQTDAVRDYFWDNGRWFLPVLGAGMDFAVNEKFKAGFDLRVWFPLYRLSEKDLPPIEGWRFGFGLRVTPR